MPKDHYVSQVHLRQFYSPVLAGKMYAIRKPTLEQFPCVAESQCRVIDGSTTTYLTEPRKVEEFLKSVEPVYNVAVDSFRNGKPIKGAIQSIAGFAAYVSCCSPASQRFQSGPLQSILNETAKVLDAQGKIPAPPKRLGAASITDALKKGLVNFEIDPKFPQALGIQSIIQRTSVFGNSNWEIVINNHKGIPFFTSDYPVALDVPNYKAESVNWLIPLAPDIAIRIRPDKEMRHKEPDLDFTKFKSQLIIATAEQAMEINAKIVQSAESIVYYRDNFDWVVPFVERYRHCRIEAVTETLPFRSDLLRKTRLRINPNSLN